MASAGHHSMGYTLGRQNRQTVEAMSLLDTSLDQDIIFLAACYQTYSLAGSDYRLPAFAIADRSIIVAQFQT